ncbi:MAG: sugar phosphate nucleotidyltransferase [Promethearchaeota archaeon]
MMVIILAAGLATRLHPLSNRIPKPLIDIYGKPLITRIIHAFKSAGMMDFLILTGYKANLIKKEVNKINGINAFYVDQEKQVGMADALLICLEFLKEKNGYISDFFLTASDILFPPKIIQLMQECHVSTEYDGILALMESKNELITRSHGNVKISGTNVIKIGNDSKLLLNISDIIEKPEPHQILSDYYSLPLYIFTSSIHEPLKKVKPSSRGEKELQDAIKLLIKNNKRITGLKIIEELITPENIGKYHLTYLRDIRQMNFQFLSNNIIKSKGKNIPNVYDPVLIEEKVKIGENVSLGPYVIVKKGVQIKNNCKISHSILYENSVINPSCELNGCIIEEKVKIPPNLKISNKFMYVDEEGNLKTKDS